MDTERRGQALLEVAVGLFAVALVVSALCGFVLCVVRSLAMQNALRVGASSQSDAVEVSPFAADWVFGADRVILREHVSMPATIVQSNTP